MPEQSVDPNLRRNIALQLVHGMFGQTGFRLFNAPTFFPTFLFVLSGSELIVGVARSLQAFGQVLSPVIGASLIGHRRRILKVSIFAGLAMRLQMLCVALCGLLLGASSAGVYSILFFMALMGFFQGMQGVMLNSLRAKVIPVQRRGFVTGWRNFLAGATTATVSYFGGSLFIEKELLGNGYAAIFLLAFFITTIGLLALAFTREPEAEVVRKRESVLESLRAMPVLLRSNQIFARFFVVRALGSFGRMAMPFYILYVGTQMDLSGTLLGVLTTIWMLTGTATNLVWGAVADRHGYRIVMVATLALWAIAHIQLISTEGVLAVMSFFVLMGMASGGFNQAGQNMVLELGESRDIPLRVAVSNTAVNFIGTIGPMTGGALALVAGYETIFVVCTVMQLIALAILLVWIPEPRNLITATSEPDTHHSRQ